MSDLTIIKREVWNARPPKVVMPKRGWDDIRELFIHYQGDGDFSWINSVVEANRHMRATQDYHMDVKDWNDIGYNLMVFQPRGALDPSECFYQARGAGYTPAAQANHNTGTLAIMVVMGDDDKLLDSTKRLLRRVVAWADDNAGRDLPVRPHSAVVATECPGSALRRFLPELRAV